MKKFEITGMSCAACSCRVEKAVQKIEGVTSCSVSLLTNSMVVEGEAEEEIIKTAVEKAGYGIRTQETKEGGKAEKNNREEILKDKETPVLKTRVISSFN